MKTQTLTLILALIVQFAVAQISFEPVPPPMPLPQIAYDFVKVNGSSATFADVNGDGYLDVLITGDVGASSSINTTVGLYINNGRGSYSQAQDVPFAKVTGGSVDFADIDGDGDLDVLMTGSFNATNTRARLYTNDGNGNFTEFANELTLLPVGSSDADFADIDGDGDQDMLIAGGSGVRAQACDRNGGLIDDFLIHRGERTINVLNAPSPAATSSLSIGESVAKLLD